MKQINISPDEVVYYQYIPETDTLAIRVKPELEGTAEEALPDLPDVALSRSKESGTVVGASVTGVQDFILRRLAQDIFTLVRPHLEAAAATPAVEPAAVEVEEQAPAKPKRKRSRAKKTQPETEQPAEADALEVTPEEVPAAMTETKPKRRTRKKKEEPQEVAPVAESTASEITLETEEVAPPKPARKRSTRRKKEEPIEAVVETVEEMMESAVAAQEAPERGEDKVPVSEEEVVPEKPKRKRRSRKKTEPEDAAEEAAPVVAEEVREVPVEQEEPEPAPTTRRRRQRRKRTESPAEAVAQVDTVERDETVPETVQEATEPQAEAEAEKAGAVAAEAVEETAATQPRKKRRRRSRKKTGREDKEERTAEQVPAVTEPQAVKSTRTQEQRTRERQPQRKQEEKVDPRRSYKTAPIEGLEIPEGFAALGMHRLLGQAIAAIGFEEPTAIQRRAVPPAMEGQDIIGLAQTGTGKTLAFLIPTLHRLLQGDQKGHRPRALILVPTRELAVQVAEEAEFLATHTDLLITTIYGGVAMGPQIGELRQGTDVIVATPGRLLDHLRRGNLRLNSIEVAILDEADRMLDMGFLPEIRQVFQEIPKQRQTFLFSATMPPAIESLSLDFQQKPVLVEVARQLPPATIEQVLYPVERHLKAPLLAHLLENQEEMRSVLVFTETKSEADVLERKLREGGINVAIMHGDRSQREREQALQQLRDGTVRVLVATNVASRGLDVTDITHVVNYDVPQTVDDYVHRIGRTARGEAEGHAYTFVTIGDEGMIMRIESALERELPRVIAPDFNYDVPTPSWAKPSAEELSDRYNKPKDLADRFRRMMRR